MISTRFTDEFGVDLPIRSAAMPMHTDGVVAAAASQTGALGSFGAIHTENPTSWVGDLVARVMPEIVDNAERHLCDSAAKVADSG